jgi:hypothetical protein
VFVTQWHNINIYLDKIYKETQIRIDPSKILKWETYKQNDHFLLANHEKPVFHKNLDVFFSKYLGTHHGNTLLVDDISYKSMFNESFNAIFVKTFDTSNRDPNDYLTFTILPYLECFHHFGISVSTFV